MTISDIYDALRREKAMPYAYKAERDEPNDDDFLLADFDIDQMSNTELMRALALHDS